ncbi:MAG: diguanylate cyclase [Sphaerochaetaceae bacterium]
MCVHIVGHRKQFLLFVMGLCVLLCIINLLIDGLLHSPNFLVNNQGCDLSIPFDLTLDGRFLATTRLPYKVNQNLRSKELVLAGTLPQTFPARTSYLHYRSSDCKLAVQVDGVQIYSFGEKKQFWKTPNYGGAYDHFIPLPPDSEGKSIRISMTFASDNPFNSSIRNIDIGNEGYVFNKAFSPTFGSLFFGLELIILALLFFFLVFFVHNKKSHRDLLSFSLLLACLGVWVFSQGFSRQIMGFSNPAIAMDFSFISLFSLPLCLYFYLVSNYEVPAIHRFLTDFALLFPVLYLFFGLLQFYGIPTVNFLILMGVLVVLFTFVLLVYCHIACRRGNKELASFVWALSFIFLSALLEEILLIFRIKITKVSLLHLGMSIAGLFFFIRTMNNLVQNKYDESKEKLLHELAYKDYLTGIGNRTAYERYLDTLQARKFPCGILMFDINNLKMVNDSFGHEKGDELIKDYSKEIQKLLHRNASLYRIGGDEFVAIFPGATQEEFKSIEQKIKAYFMVPQFGFGLAIGEQYYTAALFEKIRDAVRVADDHMYLDKKHSRT